MELLACANKGRFCGSFEYQAFAASSHGVFSAIWDAAAPGALVEHAPLVPTQHRFPVDSRTNAKQRVGPPRTSRLMRSDAASLGENPVLQVLKMVSWE